MSDLSDKRCQIRFDGRHNTLTKCARANRLHWRNVSAGNLSEVSCMLTPYGRSYLEVVAALKSHFLHATSRIGRAVKALAQGIVRDMKASASFHIAPGTAPAIPALCLFASFRTYSRVVLPRCSLISASSGSPCTPIRLGIFRVRYAR